MTDLFTTLEQDWHTFSRSTAGSAALARWSDEPALAPFEQVTDLIDVMQQRADRERRDEVMLTLVHLAVRDADACRVVLHTLLPGLKRLAGIYGRRWGRDDTASMVIAAALTRIATYPPRRAAKPAANIIRDVQHALYVTRKRELRTERSIGVAEDLDPTEPYPTTDERSGSEELVDLVTSAVTNGDLAAGDARLIVLQRVHDVPTRELADEEGWQPCTIRRRRRLAEAALARAVA